MKNLILIFITCSLLFKNSFSQQWTTFCEGSTNDFVVDFTYYKGDLIACGFFTTIGGINANRIARWDGISWQPLGTGLNNWAHSLCVFNDSLYVSGYFTTAGGITVNHIARWDGTNWSGLGGGFNGSTYAIGEYNSELIVGGDFTTADGDSASGIARWNGASWQPIGTGLTEGFAPYYNLYPHGIIEFEGDLYIGGNFTKAGGTIVNGVAKWDGTSWDSVGKGFNSDVLGFGIYNEELYAGGEFTFSDTTEVNYIAKWDGSRWQKVGLGVNAYVHTLKVFNNELYITGGFTQTALSPPLGDTLLRIAKFDGFNWYPLGKGLNYDAEPMIEYQGNLLVGGDFTKAGDSTVNRLAIWNISQTAINNIATNHSLSIYPNPASDKVLIKIDGMLKKETIVSISDILGNKIMEAYTSPNSLVTELDLNGFSSGVYFIQIVEDFQVSATRKFIIIK